MRYRWLSLTVLLVLILPGCVHNAPVTTVSTAASQADAPARDQADILFHGLIAFVFKKDDTVESVFLSPDAEPHIPLIAVNTTDIDKLNASDPDLIASGDGDAGFAVWKFTEATIDQADFSDKSLRKDMTALDLNNPDYTLLRWVPSMDDIFGSLQKVDQKEIDSAPARGKWPKGWMTPVFDELTHRTDPWTIGNRRNTPVADGVRLRLQLSDPGRPFGILITRIDPKDPTKKVDETIVVKGGATIFISDYPTKIPKPGNDLTHFRHYYTLRYPDKSGYDPVHGGPPTPYPSRCAPGVFYPPDPDLP